MTLDATVLDAGGGEIQLLVTRDTVEYPAIGSRVRVTERGMTTPESLTPKQIEVVRAEALKGYGINADEVMALLATLDARAPLDVERRDLLDIAWTIIANAGGGDWTLEAKDWQEAAAAWRERYHAALAAEGSGE